LERRGGPTPISDAGRGAQVPPAAKCVKTLSGVTIAELKWPCSWATIAGGKDGEEVW